MNECEIHGRWSVATAATGRISNDDDYNGARVSPGEIFNNGVMTGIFSIKCGVTLFLRTQNELHPTVTTTYRTKKHDSILFHCMRSK